MSFHYHLWKPQRIKTQTYISLTQFKKRPTFFLHSLSSHSHPHSQRFHMCGSANTDTKSTTTITNEKCHPSTPSPTTTAVIPDIEEIHTLAIQAKSKTYIDPATGFTVFTEYAHLKRGKCCGNVCRHCPYGWENVSYKKGGELIRREAKVKSGDTAGAQLLVDIIESGNYHYSAHTLPTSTSATTCNMNNNNETENNPSMKATNGATSIIYSGKGGRKGGKFTAKNVPYTRTGDQGTSMLLTGERRSKDDISFEAMGTVDELCSVVGVAHAEMLATIKSSDGENAIEYGELDEWLLETMSRLFDLGSHIAKPRRRDLQQCEENDDEKPFTPDGIGGGFDEVHIVVLEEWIDIMTEQLPELTSFVLPTGGKASAQLHLARCVCRRAERCVVPLVKEGVCDPNSVQYLNRLSDFLFTAARWTNFCEGKEEVQYRRYFRGANQRGRVTVSLRDEKKQP